MRKDLVVFRCKSCIEDLKEYNPYVDKEGKKIPLDRIEVIEVEKRFLRIFRNQFKFQTSASGTYQP